MTLGTTAERSAAVAIAIIVGAAVSWQVPGGSPTPTNVVVVTLDTTRADRLSPYGFAGVRLPALERLAREGVVFDQAESVAPLTLPAHTSIFTGLLPPHHAVRDNADAPLAETHATLAAMLRARGFRTGAFVGSVVLAPDRGLQRGFEIYHGVDPGERSVGPAPQRRADTVIDDAIGWLDQVAGSRFLLWAHLYDAHRPYDPPEPYRSIYGADPYEGEISFADSQLGRLLDALDRLRLTDRTVVVVTADHGESLGAHGERDHGVFVYEDTLHVPLIIRAPGLPPGRVEDLVRLTDVMPTVLDLLDQPSVATDGVSLVPMARGRRGPELEAYAESRYPARFGWSPIRALRAGRFKFIDAPRPELYDLSRDPFEEHNLYGERPAVARGLAARLESLVTDPDWRAGVSANRVAPGLRERLAALGYVGAGVTRVGTGLPDPKDCLRPDGDGLPARRPPPGCMVQPFR